MYVRQKVWDEIERTSQQLGIFLMLGSYECNRNNITEPNDVGYDDYPNFKSILKEIKRQVRKRFNFREFLNFVGFNEHPGLKTDDEIRDEWRYSLDKIINYYNCGIFRIHRIYYEDEYIYEDKLIIPSIYRVVELMTEMPSLQDWAHESISVHNVNIKSIPKVLRKK